MKSEGIAECGHSIRSIRTIALATAIVHAEKFDSKNITFLYLRPARKMFLEDPNVDAWITWAKSNPDYSDVVEIEKDLVVYRDVNVVTRKDASTETLEFIDVLKSDTVKRIFKKYRFVE